VKWIAQNSELVGTPFTTNGYVFPLRYPYQRPVSRRPHGSSPPLSFAQQQVWLHAQLAPDIPLYNEVLVLEPVGALDRRALERSFSEIALRHETLRTTFPTGAGTPVQMIGEHRGFELSTTDLRGLRDEQRKAEVLRIATQQARQPFDLTKGPLMRACLLRRSQHKCLLVISLHTLIADEWSLNLLARELGLLHRAYFSGEPSPLPDLPFQFGDYAYWQRERFDRDLLEQHISYWRKRLAGVPPVLELPTDRPRSPVQGFRGASQCFVLSKNLSESLKGLSERQGTTLYVTLLAAFQILLSRYTGQSDIVIGSIVPGRDEIGIEDLIGPFAHTVVIRNDLGDNPRFLDLLRQLGDTLRADFEHHNVPIDRLVTEIERERDLSRNPLFQVLFSLTPSISLNHWGWETADLEVDLGAAKVDLQLQLCDRPHGIFGRFTYNTDLFNATTIARMVEHFQTLLQSAAADPEQRISNLHLLTSAEHHQLVVEWNNTRAAYPKDRCAHQLFEQQADRSPDVTALAFEEQRLTYRELNRRANQLAHYLTKLGVGPDVLVGICIERSLEMVVGLLGILKAGGAYVPLDPVYPAERLSFMLEDADVPVLLAQRHLLAQLPGTNARVVSMDSDWHEIAAERADNLASRASPENLAYVIYTSGSTGRPKGVQIPHRAVVNFLASMSHRPGMTAQDRLLGLTTLSFDIAGLEIYLPLSVGACLEIVSREVSSDGRRLLSKLRSSGATVVQATPATWRMLLEAGWEGDPRLKILCGGEAVPRTLANQLVQKVGSVWNMYGPTETTIWSTTAKVERGKGAVSIGRPIANTQVFLLDKLLQPVPIGIAGELYIGGDGLARGYLKRPELTAEKFVPNPFNSKSRLYNTGDMARYLPNGHIEFLGRVDHQVKIRGFRIELGDVEAAIRQHPAVDEIVVVAREDVEGDKQLVSYFVAEQKTPPTAVELRNFIKGKLPEYMVPSVFVRLAMMPLTPNGKINRRALPAPDRTDLTIEEEFAPPKDDVESKLAQIWQSVLRVRPIGIKHNFFELGGHSLMAVRLMHRIDRAFGKELPIATLFQAPTIAQLAALLRQKGWMPRQCSLVAIQPGGSKPPFFCVHGAGGAVIRFYDLARYLGSDQPVYGFQAQGLAGIDSFHRRVEDMAADYIDEMRGVQPEGPYFLGGYSFGGLVALEMAQQLITHGSMPSTVVLFDTFCPVSENGSLSERCSALLKVLRGGAAQTRTISRVAKTVKRKVQVSLAPRSVKQVRRACLQAAVSYVLRVYPGRIILFRSHEKSLTQLRDPHAGWSAYAGQGLEIHEIVGDHDDILLEPQVRSVAEQLKACLDSALSTSGNAPSSKGAGENVSA
jgi:surfactin family lipopeptide synthetase A